MTTHNLPEHPPEVGQLVRVRSRQWLVEEVVPPAEPGQTALVRLSCADDDNQGQSLDVFWDYELDRRIISEEGWATLGSRGFDAPTEFGAFLHTLRWNCVTATDPNLFQAPFRAGIKIDYPEAVERTQNILRKMGVERALTASGARSGDAVTIAGIPFNFAPDHPGEPRRRRR